ncbi:hypothetical protein Taro_020543 [Colocasia esculenta]|uniref:Uncharacterized protein n=1 Tax=Colocasia esculenta TaxID=4460 RepID=A0A843UWK1_COLES|nr:hypothetical protein [Colocasia esculenta]
MGLRQCDPQFLKRIWPNRAGEALLDPGEELLWLFGAIWRFGGVLVALSTQGRCMERGRRRAIASLGVLREGDGFRILRRRRFRLSRPGHGRPLGRDSVSCRAISWCRDQKAVLASIATATEGFVLYTLGALVIVVYSV